MNNILTPLEAYKAMIYFLDVYYDKTLSDDLGSLLGDLQLSDDGFPFDQAAWQDWNRALNSKEPITVDNAFRGMISFLNDYCQRTSSEDIRILLNYLQQQKDENFIAWNSCIESVNNVVINKLKP